MKFPKFILMLIELEVPILSAKKQNLFSIIQRLLILSLKLKLKKFMHIKKNKSKWKEKLLRKMIKGLFFLSF